MATNSKIEWTDHTLNLWWGCEKVHSGCKNCYAETFANRWPQSQGLWKKGDRLEIKSWEKNLAKYNAEAQNVPFFMKKIDKVQPIPDDLLIREFPKGLN